MSLPPNPSGSAGNSHPSEEARMRRALGLQDDPAPGEGSTPNRPGEQRQAERPIQRREPDRRPRRFVKDGEVPVVVLSGSREHGADAPAPVNRLAAAESALEAERATRERAERALQEALATVQQLRTQIAHTSLAHGEALAAERNAREVAERARTEADALREALETELHALKATAVAPVPAPVSRRARQPRPEPREPEPVKWWLPSYRAKTRKP